MPPKAKPAPTDAVRRMSAFPGSAREPYDARKMAPGYRQLIGVPITTMQPSGEAGRAGGKVAERAGTQRGW
jgi:hypothetical protein